MWAVTAAKLTYVTCQNLSKHDTLCLKPLITGVRIVSSWFSGPPSLHHDINIDNDEPSKHHCNTDHIPKAEADMSKKGVY